MTLSLRVALAASVTLTLLTAWRWTLDDRFRAVAHPSMQEPIITGTRGTGVVVNENKTVADDAVGASFKSCFARNTARWLAGPRLGNHVDGVMDEPDLQDMLVGLDTHWLSRAPLLVGQTICHDTSRFRNLTADDRRVAAVRLVYLATLYHQHRHASVEAQDRLSSSCGDALHAKQIGRFDFECPSAKYLVASLADIGLGANLRGGAVEAFMAGLAADRVVLFINNSQTGHKFLRMPWQLTSCPRMDFQCFFRAPSPCVLTAEDLQSAYRMNSGDQRRLLKKGETVAGHEDDKVWHWTLSYTPQGDTPAPVTQRLYQHAQTLLAGLSRDDPRREHWKAAAEAILEPDERRPGYNYGAANVMVHHALVIYAMRPHRSYLQKINAIVQEINTGIDPESAVGLPIRASDKCIRESECLTFGEHLQATIDLWRQRTNTTINDPTIVFTSESQSMVAEQRAFSTNATAQGALSIPFRIVSNTKDVTPDTGFVSDATGRGNASFSADDALLSAVSSIKFQLLPRLTLANCCSNFHVLLGDLLAGGCGAAESNSFHCMQENEDPALRVCCGWFKNCKEEKRTALAERQVSLLNSNEAIDEGG